MPAHHVATIAVEETDADRGRIVGVVIGRFLGFNDAGEALVDYPGNPSAGARPAAAIASLRPIDRGRDAALLFQDGDPLKPIVVGLMAEPVEGPEARAVQRDDETLILKAEREIVLQCGKASITLTRAGKVLIRGAYVSSRSSGVNTITGGVIHLN